MASGMTPAKRFLVRTALITGTTLSVVVGAQTLATLDLQRTTTPDTNPSGELTVNTNVANPAGIIKAAPSLVIVRHPPQVAAAPTQPNRPKPAGIVAQPPAPVAIQAPPPVVVQPQQSSSAPASAPSAPPATHSTR